MEDVHRKRPRQREGGGKGGSGASVHPLSRGPRGNGPTQTWARKMLRSIPWTPRQFVLLPTDTATPCSAETGSSCSQFWLLWLPTLLCAPFMYYHLTLTATQFYLHFTNEAARNLKLLPYSGVLST